MKLNIKNMVCRHCVATVRHLLADELNLAVEAVGLGYAVIAGDLDSELMEKIRSILSNEGFELIHDRESEIVESRKRDLIDLSRRDDGEKVNLTEYLSCRSGLSYASLSRLFSEIEGRTIENYMMNLRVERVKELIKYGQKSFSEIAYVTGYSSVAHLSRQFKQLTGMTPTQFRDMGRRRPLPEV